MNIDFESRNITRRSFLKGAGVVGAAGLLSACGGSTQKDTKPVKQDTTKLTQYVLNTSTMKFHKPDCSGVENNNVEVRRFSILG